MTAIDLKDIVSNGDNTREPAPALQGMGYGVVEPVEGADRPTLFFLALGTPEDKRDYCHLVERYEGSLVDLAASIDREGQLLNCRVRPHGQDKYVLTFGARRCLAVLYLHARDGKPAVVWATVSEGDDRQALIESAAENAHRLPPSYIDQARLFRRMRDRGMTVKDIAALYPMGRSAEQNIRHRLRLLELPPEVQIKVHHGRLSQDAALKLMKTPVTKDTTAPATPPQHEKRGLPDDPPAASGDDLRTALQDFIARLTALDLDGVPPADPDELLRLADEARHLLSAVEEAALKGTPVPAR